MIWADDTRALARQRGFLGELAAQGCNDAELVTVPAPSTLTLGRQGLAELYSRGAKPRPYSAARISSPTAHSRKARSRGLSVPGDVALMGFGDLEFAQHTYPALSTVRIDRAAIGRRAAELILARIDGQTPSEKVVDVGFTIVDRQTT
jgi:LacI family gluconate utilization system Gnt-I transcriptional repressor